MKKLFLLLILVGFIINVAGGQSKSAVIKISLNGQAAQVPLKISNANKFTVKPILSEDGTTRRIELISPKKAEKEWSDVSVSFVPGLGGEIAVARSNAVYSADTEEWIECRNFKISGGTVAQTLHRKMNKLPDGSSRCSYRAVLVDAVRVEKDKPVTVSFQIRRGGSDKFSSFTKKDWYAPEQKHTPYWKDNAIMLLGPDDRGDSFAFYGNFYRAEQRAESWLNEAPAVPQKSFAVPVELLEEHGVGRNVSVRFGFPLPDKSFYNTDNIAVFSPDGKKIPAKIMISSVRSNMSIKWLLIEFETYLKAKERTCFTVKGGGEVKAKTASPILKKISGNYKVSSGGLSADCNPASGNLLENISFNGENFGSLTLKSGKNSFARIKEVVSEENDTVLRLEGQLFENEYIGAFTARLYFGSTAPFLRTLITWRADNLARELNELRSLSLELSAGEGKLASGTEKVFQLDDKTYLADKTVKSGFMPDTDIFVSGKKRIAFGIKDAGMRYPKAYSSVGKKLSIELLPEQPCRDFNTHLPGYLRFPYMNGKYRMMAGMNFTEEIYFDFSGKSLIPADIVAVVPKSWYAECPDTVRGVLNDSRSELFDSMAVKAFEKHMQLKKSQREYGFLNYGDWFGERRGMNWGNNEYDFAYGLLTLFARTGNRDVWRLGMAAARHQSDVDIIHAVVAPLYLGGNYMHSVGHSGRRGESGGVAREWYTGLTAVAYASATNGHSWSGGMFTAYLLGGKSDIGDSALAAAAHAVKHAVIPFKLSGNPRSHGWLLENLMQAYDATGEQEYLDAGTCIANRFFEIQQADKQLAWPHKLHPGYRGVKDGFGAACFQIGIVTQALHHYVRNSKRTDVGKNMEAAAAWLRKTYDPYAAGWPYSALADGSPLWMATPRLNMLLFPGANADGKGNDILREGLFFYQLCGMAPDGVGKELALSLLFAPVFFEMIRDMPMEDFSEAALNRFITKPRLMRLRGPESMELEVTLPDKELELKFKRSFYNHRKSDKRCFQVKIISQNGKIVSEFSGELKAAEFVKNVKLHGRAGDVFKIMISDNVSSYWEVANDVYAAVRIKLKPNSQFSNGVPLAFRVRVPAGIKDFSIVLNGLHPGEYGMAVADSSGKIVFRKSSLRTNGNFPWLSTFSAADVIKADITRSDCSKEDVYYFMTWSAGDVILSVENIPPYLEHFN